MVMPIKGWVWGHTAFLMLLLCNRYEMCAKLEILDDSARKSFQIAFAIFK